MTSGALTPLIATLFGVAAVAVGLLRGLADGEPADPVATQLPAGDRAAVATPGTVGASAAPAALTPIVPAPRPRRPQAEPGDGIPEGLEPAAVPAVQRLPAGDAARLAQLARQLLIVDLTGAGRDRLPAGWGTQTPRPCCQAVTVHRAAAGRHPARDDIALVLATWSGTRRDTGQAIAATVTPLAFRRDGDGWRPFASWEVP